MDSQFAKELIDRLVAQEFAKPQAVIEEPYEPQGPQPNWNVNNAALLAAILGPLADGASTMWAMNQSGPHVRVGEGNGLYGKAPSGGKILGIKVGQALLQGLIAKLAGKQGRAGQDAANVMGLTSGLYGGGAAAWNIHQGLKARKLNGR